MSKADDLLTIGSISDSGCTARSRGYRRQSGRVVVDRDMLAEACASALWERCCVVDKTGPIRT